MYGVMGRQYVVGSVRLGLGGDADGGLGSGTGGVGGGDRQYGNGYGQLIRWEDTVANVFLGTEPNPHIAYNPGLELHHLIMSMLGGHRRQLDR